MTVIPALKILKQENWNEFEVSQGCITISCFKNRFKGAWDLAQLNKRLPWNHTIVSAKIVLNFNPGMVVHASQPST